MTKKVQRLIDYEIIRPLIVNLNSMKENTTVNSECKNKS